MDLAPFRRRRRRHRVSEVVLPKIFDAVTAYLGEEEMAAKSEQDVTMADKGGANSRRALSESELQEEECADAHSQRSARRGDLDCVRCAL